MYDIWKEADSKVVKFKWFSVLFSKMLFIVQTVTMSVLFYLELILSSFQKLRRNCCKGFHVHRPLVFMLISHDMSDLPSGDFDKNWSLTCA